MLKGVDPRLRDFYVERYREDDRREAGRVARPGAPVLAAAISRHAALMDVGADGRLTDDFVPFVEELHRTGAFDTDRLGFTHCHFHTPAELGEELAEAGLTEVEVLGIEGPAGPALDARGLERIGEFLPAAVRAARIVERDPALIASSGHLLGVARVG